MQLRTIKITDYLEINSLIKEAFENSEYGYNGEAEIVTQLRFTNCYVPELEIIAVENNKIIGHGLLSEVEVINKNKTLCIGLALAPLSVAPAYQGRKIGETLLLTLETKAKELNYKFITILGSASYYSRYGYTPASQYDIEAPFDVPDESFMIKILSENALDGISGVIQYSEAFN